MLRDGGNAVDAAVATAFAEAVTWPAAGNIGGGGFMVIYPHQGEPIVVDYREKAPLAATPTMLQKRDDANYAHKTVGVPGTVAGLTLAHQKYGRLRWKHVLAPSIKLAEEGFPIDRALARSMYSAVRETPANTEFCRVYGKQAGKERWQAGDTLVLPDLAWTLHQLADEGPDGFYKGAVAEKIIAEMKAGGGLIIKQDLGCLPSRIAQADPRHLSRLRHLCSAAGEFGGNLPGRNVEHSRATFDLKKHDRWSPETLHIMTETMRRAYRDRARFLGDSDFVRIPGKLISKEYARELAAGISLEKATRSEDLAKDIPLAGEGENTTHFSVIDKDGMAVSNTYTLENSFGSRIVVRGAGFLVNNEMTDFNTHPGVTDRRGSIGTDANLIAPGKRMLSSMTPVVVSRNGKVVLVTGSPGSRTIINTVLCILVNVLDYGMDIRSAVDAPRLHHQWFPDVVHLEESAKYPEAVAALRKLGHRVTSARQGDAHSIWVDPKTGLYYGAADKRVDGKAAGY